MLILNGLIERVVDEITGKLTLTVIKCDCGSIGGHTAPTPEMINKVISIMSNFDWVIDLVVTHTGDDIAIIITHQLGANSATVHKACRSAFEAASKIAADQGLYGAGQDLHPASPSGNVRGTGPGVAEAEFPFLPKHRPAESIAIISADKCGPGAYNQALYHAFADPATCSGFLLSPEVGKGFIFVIEDMDHKVKKNQPKTRRQIRLDSRTEKQEILALLRQIDRFAVTQIVSVAIPGEIAVASTTDRLHNITGTYQGKDDPVMIVRTQKIFPALEEVIDPFRRVPLVTGDARGSHTMPLTPVAINTPVDGPYCQPIVACLSGSISSRGKLIFNDIFGGATWDSARAKASAKVEMMREQAPFGIAMASQEEIAYTGLEKLQIALDKRFKLVPERTND